MSEDWLKFDNFIRDMGRKPGPKYELDRIDNNGHYEKGNVRWTIRRYNCRNKRNNVWLPYKGGFVCQDDAQMLTGIPWHVLMRRRLKGITSEEQLYAPARKVRR